VTVSEQHGIGHLPVVFSHAEKHRLEVKTAHIDRRGREQSHLKQMQGSGCSWRGLERKVDNPRSEGCDRSVAHSTAVDSRGLIGEHSNVIELDRSEVTGREADEQRAVTHANERGSEHTVCASLNEGS